MSIYCSMEEPKLKTANRKEYYKNYYQNHKDKYVRKQPKLKSYCPLCDCELYIESMPYHLNSKKHQSKFRKSAPILIDLNVEF